ncbi:zinc ribbon domain-containing protein [Asanoa sp. WMMD1127]|uniref:zinc ribbon domain-containing protein n=1 Tax=Asanoa sp. WMMD1127 TaxID=3016107 RepID=UPI0032428612
MSKDVVHEPLVDDHAFEQTQATFAKRARTATSARRTNSGRHPYIFKSLVHCGICQRKMQGLHAHGTAYYRCRYPQEYAVANSLDHPRNVIMREEALIRPLDTWLVQELNPAQRMRTVAKLVEQAQREIPTSEIRLPDGPTVADCDAKLARYRRALDAGADPAVVASWIAETQADREQALERRTGPAREATNKVDLPNAEEITSIVEELGDLVSALREAEPEHKLDVYGPSACT